VRLLYDFCDQLGFVGKFVGERFGVFTSLLGADTLHANQPVAPQSSPRLPR
jgi:hypothetical protein